VLLKLILCTDVKVSLRISISVKSRRGFQYNRFWRK